MSSSYLKNSQPNEQVKENDKELSTIGGKDHSTMTTMLKTTSLQSTGMIQIRLEFKFRFYLERSMLNEYEKLLEELLNHLYKTSFECSSILSSHSFCQIEFKDHFIKQMNDDEFLKNSYQFDKHFIGNLNEEHLDKLSKVEFSYLIESSPNDNDSLMTCSKHRRLFGQIQAYVRHGLRARSSYLSSLNDNFLNFLPSLRFDANDAYRRLKELASINKKVLKLIECCEEQINLANDNSKGWCLSFNGGKDCTVLLHTLVTLYRVSKKALYSDHQNDMVHLLMIKTSDLFAEQDLYIERIKAYYGCKMNVFYGKDLKDGLKLFHQTESFSTIFMGCRRTDFSPSIANKLSTVQKTDAGWPEFMRINPLLDWSYDDVWSFLLNQQVPYCPLYDYGYTSIDRTDNTEPNPNLSQTSFNFKLTATEPDHKFYLPAYLLERDETERSSRENKQQTRQH